MNANVILSTTEIRRLFSDALQEMFSNEMQQFNEVLDIVNDVNSKSTNSHPETLLAKENIHRRSELRHGAIRLASLDELEDIANIFEICGMLPSDFYNLAETGGQQASPASKVPFISTAFVPQDQQGIQEAPFRMFCSVINPDELPDEIKADYEAIVAKRNIIPAKLKDLFETYRLQGGFTEEQAGEFVHHATQTFRWSAQTIDDVTTALYTKIREANNVSADTICFQTAQMNHETVATGDIEAVHKAIKEHKIPVQGLIQGPPLREVPILLRQFARIAHGDPAKDSDGVDFNHKARFVEIEERGIPLTPKGRELYDRLLNKTILECAPLKGHASYNEIYTERLVENFKDFPDTVEDIIAQDLAYFKYVITEAGLAAKDSDDLPTDLEDLVKAGFVKVEYQVYENFLPHSAAGIFAANMNLEQAQKNLGDADPHTLITPTDEVERQLTALAAAEPAMAKERALLNARYNQAMGKGFDGKQRETLNPYDYYAAIEAESITKVGTQLGLNDSKHSERVSKSERPQPLDGRVNLGKGEGHNR